MRERDVRLLMEISPDREIVPGWQRGVQLQRTKSIKAGDLLYCSSYPVWTTAARADAAKRLQDAKGKARAQDAQRRLNARNAQARLEQIINANFGAGDLLVTCTYPSGKQPEDDKQVTRDMRNYIARLRRMCERKGIPAPAYVYVTESTESNRWGKRYHTHMILRADGLTREQAEAAWSKASGGICNTKRAARLPEGLTGWARYMAKQVCAAKDGDRAKSRHRWCASKGLKVPQPTVADKKISMRRVERIARDIEREPVIARAYMEACYPGYELLEMQVRTSEWVGGAYIYAVLTRKEGTHGRERMHPLQGLSGSGGRMPRGL